jgi:hypothetical protein
MTSRPTPQCITCAHWVSPLDRTDDNAAEAEPTQECKAFPLADGGIPDDIWWNRFDHRQPHEGDHGIQWEQLDSGTPFPEWAMATDATAA